MTLHEHAQEINHVGRNIGVDVRLEVLLAELMQGGLDPRRDVLIYPQGLFSRDYRPDVGVSRVVRRKQGSQTGDSDADSPAEDNAGVANDTSGVWAGPAHVFEGEEPNPNIPDHPEFLNIPVFRDGLYDYLPEGLFHQPTVEDEDEFGKEIDEQAKRKQAARRFFRPIEQEFYLQGVLLELEERKYLVNEENLSRDDQGEVLRGIWGLPADRLVRVPRPNGAGWTVTRAPLLDVRQLNNILHLLPIAHRLVNNRALVEQVLALMLGVPVQLRTIPPLLLLIELEPGDRAAPNELAQIELGNFSLEGVYQDTMPAVEIRLGPLSEAELTDFLPEGRSRAVLDLLLGYFLPAETEVVTHLITDEANRFLTLADEGQNPTSVLGWASYI